MKLPITDEFLCFLYDTIELTDEIYNKVFPREWWSLRTSTELNKLKREYEKKKARRSFSQFIYYLKKKGYIKIKNLEGKTGILLSKNGKEKALRAKLKITRKKKRRKDGKWLMVIFDIPEKKRYLRDLLRENLQWMDYKMLQKSIWVCPYDFFRETEEIIRRHSINPYVKIFLIEEIQI